MKRRINSLNLIYALRNTLNDKIYVGKTWKLVDGKRVWRDK